jgi:CelD/BcsL family acetyltransferase involved in cellulose biosynthesis
MRAARVPRMEATDVGIERAESLDAVHADWMRLGEASLNLFSTWEWADAWWRHHGDRARALPLRCRNRDGEVVAIVPLCVSRVGPLRMARLIGHGAADELGPVCEASRCEPVARAVSLYAAEHRPWDVLLAERVAPTADWSQAWGATTLNREASPVIDVEGTTWEEYLGSRSSNFRSQVRRKERKLLREHGLVYRLSDDPARLAADMQTLFDLHELRWRDGASSAFDHRRRAFHQEFAAVALQRGWLRLWLAEADGDPVAAWYGFRFGGREWYYQFGRDPAWDRLSVGLVLMAHTVREAIAGGVSEYRLLRGGETYKDRFATRDPGVATVAAPEGVRGRLAVAAARAALALPDPLRRLVVGRVG